MADPAVGHLLNHRVLKAPPGCEAAVREGGNPREIVKTTVHPTRCLRPVRRAVPTHHP